MTQCATCKAKMPNLQTRLHRVNKALHALGLVYHPTVPMPEIEAILSANGFEAYGEDNQTGIGDISFHRSVGEGKYLHMSWYQMPSGRFEVTAYVN